MIGGNHGTGAEVVRAATAAGHEVTSVSRTPSQRLPAGVAERLGDAGDPAVAAAGVAGADAVVVTVGGATGVEDNRARVTRAVIVAMQAAGVRRLVVQSSLGVGDSMSLLPAPARLFARTVLGRALLDHADQELAVTASGLDWTILRPGGLTDGPATGDHLAQETAEHRAMTSRISRAELADYLVSILDDATTWHKALALATR